MKRSILTLPPQAKPKSTAQQNADFTAEGSPPPGKVAQEAPELTTDAPHPGRKAAKGASSAALPHKRPELPN